jgi:AraC-like DNA-binding protein
MGHNDSSQEQILYFVGVRNVPVSLSSPPGKTCFIGIEFHPSGAYPILQIPMVELTNRRLFADELSGTWNRSLTEMLRNHKGIFEKVDFIQERLLRRLKEGRSPNPVVAYCVDYLKLTNGAASIQDLELKTGYEKRHLESLFSSNVGVSPKTLSRIFRFQWFYRKWARVPSFDHLKEDVHEYFYDEAHFNKEFKRMTGFPPKHYFLKVPNRFGRQLSQH